MNYSMYGAAAAVVLVAGVGAYSVMDRAANYKPAKASVYLIDRKCDIIETTKSADGTKTVRDYNDDCKSIAAWETAKGKRDDLKAGDEIDILVSNSDPSKVRAR